MLGLWNGKKLTDKDILTLTQFISVLNYFAGVNLLVWIRNIYGNVKPRHPVFETVMHVYLYVVYLLQVFNVVVKQKDVVVVVDVVFVVVMFACQVNMCHNSRRLIREKSTSTTFNEKKERPRVLASIVVVIVVWFLSASVGVVVIASEGCWRYDVMMAEYLTMASPAASFNFMLKVSFMTVCLESYFIVVLSIVCDKNNTIQKLRLPSINTITNTDKCLILQQTTENTKTKTPAISLHRAVVSVFAFAVMSVFAMYPQMLNVLFETKLSTEPLHMTGAIILQMVFIVDASIYIASYHIQRWLNVNGER